MARLDQMRAAWSRRTDDELLHAYFVEELTPDGRALVTELVTAKVGAIDAYVRGFAIEQGDEEARFPVRSCVVDFGVKQSKLPVMWGQIVLAAKGIGFIPAGHDDALGDARVGESVGGISIGDAGTLVGMVGDSIWSGMKHTAHPVENLSRLAIALPLLARFETNAIWLPHGSYDAVLWGPDYGEVMLGGERLFAVEAAEEAEAMVSSWAAKYEVPLTEIAASSMFR